MSKRKLEKEYTISTGKGKNRTYLTVGSTLHLGVAVKHGTTERRRAEYRTTNPEW